MENVFLSFVGPYTISRFVDSPEDIESGVKFIGLMLIYTIIILMYKYFRMPDKISINTSSVLVPMVPWALYFVVLFILSFMTSPQTLAASIIMTSILGYIAMSIIYYASLKSTNTSF